MTPRILSCSSMIGTNVRNQQGEDLGKIKEFMIDTRSGHVEYVVLSFGGFLGMGDKYFAVPLEAFTIDSEHEDFVLNVDRAKLESAPGFDKDNWPKTGDSDFTNRVYSHYGYQRRQHSYDNEGRYSGTTLGSYTGTHTTGSTTGMGSGGTRSTPSTTGAGMGHNRSESEIERDRLDRDRMDRDQNRNNPSSNRSDSSRTDW